MSVMTERSPGMKRQAMMRLPGAPESDTDDMRLPMLAALDAPSTSASGVSRKSAVSLCPLSARQALALARTMGKCLWRASTTSTASRRLSKAVSANARVALVARRRKSGDVAIRWNPGNPRIISITLYAPELWAYTRSTNMRESLKSATADVDIGNRGSGADIRGTPVGDGALLRSGG